MAFPLVVRSLATCTMLFRSLTGAPALHVTRGGDSRAGSVCGHACYDLDGPVLYSIWYIGATLVAVVRTLVPIAVRSIVTWPIWLQSITGPPALY